MLALFARFQRPLRGRKSSLLPALIYMIEGLLVRYNRKKIEHEHAKVL
jgi:hypothetical protein